MITTKASRLTSPFLPSPTGSLSVRLSRGRCGNETAGQTMARGALTVQIINWEGLKGQSGPLRLATDLPVRNDLGASSGRVSGKERMKEGRKELRYKKMAGGRTERVCTC